MTTERKKPLFAVRVGWASRSFRLHVLRLAVSIATAQRIATSAVQRL